MNNYDIYLLTSSRGEISQLKPLGKNYLRLIEDLKTRPLTSWYKLRDNYPDHPYLELLRDKKLSNDRYRRVTNSENLEFVISLNSYSLIQIYCEINNVDLLRFLAYNNKHLYVLTKLEKDMSYIALNFNKGIHALNLKDAHFMRWVSKLILPIISSLQDYLVPSSLNSLIVWSLRRVKERNLLSELESKDEDEISEVLVDLITILRIVNIDRSIAASMVTEIIDEWEKMLNNWSFSETITGIILALPGENISRKLINGNSDERFEILSSFI